jgi:hypothetical protein
MPSVVTLTGPGTATVTDDAAVAIIAQTAALIGPDPTNPLDPANLGPLSRIANNLGTIGLNSVDLKNEIVVLTQSLNELKLALGSITTMSAGTNAIIAMQAANQIKTNNFQVEATKAALKNTDQQKTLDDAEAAQGTIKQQLTTAVKDSATLMEVGQAEGFVVNQINTMATNFAGWVGGFLPSYNDIKGFFGFKNVVTVNPAPTGNAADVERKATLLTGEPPTNVA